MKPIYLLLTLLLPVPPAAPQEGAQPTVKQYTIEQFMNTESIAGSSFSSDGSLLLYSSNKSGIYNAYTVPVTGGAPTQLTDSKTNSIFAISFFPEDNRILYSSDEAGNEISHLFVREEDGRTTDLTPFAGARAQFIDWSRDKKSLFFTSNKRDQRLMDVYELYLSSMQSTIFFQNDSGYDIGTVSYDKRYLALVRNNTTNDNDMYLYDRTSGLMEHLTPHTGEATYAPVQFGVDSRRLYFLTDEGSEFTYLKEYSITTGATRRLDEAPWDIMSASFSYSEKYRVISINSDAKTEIRVIDQVTKKPVKLPSLPNADITSVTISDDESMMSFYVNGSRSPSNLFVHSFKTRKYLQLTNTMNPEINQRDLVDAQVVRFPSYDKLRIPAVLYKPYQASRKMKAPALVMVHGGPGGQARIGYSALKQFLVNHGYVVLDINNRGSSGYGRKFLKMDDRKHGDADLGDCVAARDYLAKTVYVDSSRIGIMGGSYGGFMVLAALAFRPEVFAAGVDLFGVSNWLRTLQSIPPWWDSFKNALYDEMGNPETDSAYLYGISPLFHADRITKPMIILQGANDPRVLKVESDEIVQKLRERGVPVEYVVFPDEGHGFVKKENQIKAYQSILEFLDTHLRGMATKESR